MKIENLVNLESFNEKDFIEYITSTFDIKVDKEESNSDFKHEYIKRYTRIAEKKVIKSKKIGFFIVESSTPNIEKIRVGFNNFIGTLITNATYQYKGLMFAIYHPSSKVWRLSYVALDDNRELSTQPKRYTFELGNVPTTTAETQLGNLKKDSTLEDIKKAFSVEKLSDEFFREYKKKYIELIDTLKNQNIFTNEGSVKLFAKKLLGRIVFLYFLQKKGWLASQQDWGDGDKEFLRNCFDNKDDKYAEYNNFYLDILIPVFGKALNTNRENNEDYFELLNCKMPFLNGGLFTLDDFEKKVIIENKVIDDILGLFDNYNFTIIEDTPLDSEVAIDPEMLGRVFEDLLEDRKDKGAFYTPREIVHYMCQQSIKNYLSPLFDDKKILEELVLNHNTDNEFIKNNLHKITTSLNNIKVLDPAIGSGAFPMGMLHEIVSILEALRQEEINDDFETLNTLATFKEKRKLQKQIKEKLSSNLKRQVIQNSIYGIDIEPSAVEIAKLRFWLSIVVDEDKPEPLPNLFYKIMVGNSLLETIDAFNPLEKQNKRITKTKIRNAENQTADDIIVLLQEDLKHYFTEHDSKQKKELNKNINNRIISIMKKSKDRLDTTKSLLEEVKSDIKIREYNLNIVKKIDKIIDDYSLNKNTTEIFLYKIYFKNVIDNGGFDVVIGNPPYVRQEKIKELKPKLKLEGYKSYCGTADLYVYFFEKGYNLLKPNGVLSYITSNKYTRAKYGKEFRNFLLESTDISTYIDFHNVKVFKSATTDTSILSFKKSINKNTSFIYCDIDSSYKKTDELEKFIKKKGFEYQQSDLQGDSFSFANPEELKIKNKIEKVGIPLKKWNIDINRGVLTGFNEAFVIDGKTKEQLIKQDAKSAEIIKPLLRGRDIKRYYYEFADKYLIFSKRGININNYSAIKEYLYQNYEKLKPRNNGEKIGRKKGTYEWYEIQDITGYYKDFEKEKIVWLELSDKNKFTIEDKFYPLAGVFLMNGKNLKYLLAFLNSKVIGWHFPFICNSSGVGTNQWKKVFVENLCIPKVTKEEQKPFEILVDEIMSLKEQGKDTQDLEDKIDGMVYELYELSDDEVALIEDNI